MSIELEPELKVTKEQINNSNKSKIRCIKQKIYKQLRLPKEEMKKNMTERWFKRIRAIKLPPGQRLD